MRTVSTYKTPSRTTLLKYVTRHDEHRCCLRFGGFSTIATVAITETIISSVWVRPRTLGATPPLILPVVNSFRCSLKFIFVSKYQLRSLFKNFCFLHCPCQHSICIEYFVLERQRYVYTPNHKSSTRSVRHCCKTSIKNSLVITKWAIFCTKHFISRNFIGLLVFIRKKRPTSCASPTCYNFIDKNVYSV